MAPLASLWRGRYWARLESQVVSDIRFLLFHKLQQLSFPAYARTTSGELLSRFSNDLSAISNALTMGVGWGRPSPDSIASSARSSWRFSIGASPCSPA